MLSVLRSKQSAQKLKSYVSLCSRMKVQSLSTQQQEKNDSQNQNTKYKMHEANTKFVTDTPRLAPMQHLKNLVTIYGPVATVLHISLSLFFLGSTYVVIRYGFDAPTFLAKYNFLSEKYLVIIANSGTFGLAYALYKAAMPFRILVTLFVTPRAARILQRYGVIKRKF